MQLTLRVDTGDGPQDVTTNLWAIVAWERKYKTKASKMAEGLGMEDLAYLAYEASKANKVTVPAVFDDYLRRIVTLDVVSSDDRPTREAPDDAS
jgi:hypothetical protein